jgi:hypothetical protein
MLKRIDGYYIWVVTNDGLGAELTIPPFPPGTNVYATISLSWVEHVSNNGRYPPDTRAARAWIDSWTTYLPDGTESPPFYPGGMPAGAAENAAGIENCATITFVLQALVAYTRAQINVYVF